MKGIETSSASLGSTNNNILESLQSTSTNDVPVVEGLDAIRTMFPRPPAKTTKESKVLDNLFDGMTTASHVVDYCDNEAQIQVLRHHYTNEFGGQQQNEKDEAEVLKDYNENSIIHKVVDDMPSTYRGRDGAIHAWHDLSSYLHNNGNINFDLTHVKVCNNHAQVNWKVECGDSDHHHKTLFGTDSFTFDDTNHIKMQTTVALSEAD